MAGAHDNGKTVVKDGVTNPYDIGLTPNRTRDIQVRAVTDTPPGDGYVMDASREDWTEIADARGETDENGYIRQTVAHYPAADDGELVGIHFDASELAEVFAAIATLDLASVGENVPRPRIDTQPYEAYDGAEETVQVAFYQRGERQFLLEYYDACAETYRITLYERDQTEWDNVAHHEFGEDEKDDSRLLGSVRRSDYAPVIEGAADHELVDRYGRLGDLARAVYGLWTDRFDNCLAALGVSP